MLQVACTVVVLSMLLVRKPAGVPKSRVLAVTLQLLMTVAETMKGKRIALSVPHVAGAGWPTLLDCDAIEVLPPA